MPLELELSERVSLVRELAEEELPLLRLPALPLPDEELLLELLLLELLLRELLEEELEELRLEDSDTVLIAAECQLALFGRLISGGGMLPNC